MNYYLVNFCYKMEEIERLLNNLDKFWEKTIVYEYHSDSRDLKLKENKPFSDDDILEEGLIYLSGNKHKFKFIPSTGYSPEEGDMPKCYKCKPCVDHESSSEDEDMDGGYDSEESFNEFYNFTFDGYCSDCRLKYFKDILKENLLRYMLWCHPLYDDNHCIMCTSSFVFAIDPIGRDINNRRTLVCAEHINCHYPNKSDEQTLNEYRAKKHAQGLRMYSKLMNFLNDPVPREIFNIIDSEGNVVPATLKEIY